MRSDGLCTGCSPTKEAEVREQAQARVQSDPGVTRTAMPLYINKSTDEIGLLSIIVAHAFRTNVQVQAVAAAARPTPRPRAQFVCVTRASTASGPLTGQQLHSFFVLNISIATHKRGPWLTFGPWQLMRTLACAATPATREHSNVNQGLIPSIGFE